MKELAGRVAVVTGAGSDTVVDQSLDAVRKNRRRVLVGPDAKLFDLLTRLLPSGYQRLVTTTYSFSRVLAR
jgi:hypothetical protein